ncbi:MAG TPA: hypothetical protein PKH58_01385 [Paludibacteraceae bacterium]|nr:hypothetical protein [Paludibacteraceae bacterium]
MRNVTTINLQAPKAWNELSGSQLNFIARQLIRKAEAAEIMVNCFLQFTGLSIKKKYPYQDNNGVWYRFRKRGVGSFDLDADRFTWLAKKLEWITDDISLFHNPKRILWFTGCNYKMYGVSFERWFLLDQYYGAYCHSRDQESLNKMIAVCYRRKGEAWDDGKNMDKRAWLFRFVPLYRKYVVFLWYTSLKKYLSFKYPHVFSSDSGGVTVKPSANELIMGITSALNDGNITLNPQIRKTDVHEVLFELNRKIESSLKI